MHDHEFDKSHSFATELLLEGNIENLGECRNDNIDLSLVQDFQRCWIFELKVSLVLQEHAWK